MGSTTCVEQLNVLLDQWEQVGEGEGVLDLLAKVAELFEDEYELYIKMDPDPSDDRHPSRIKPNCGYGHLLKHLFRRETFVDRLVAEYLMYGDDDKLQALSCRLLLDILPGLDAELVFSERVILVERLIGFAQKDNPELQSYALGLLTSAFDSEDNYNQYKELVNSLVPVQINKLRTLIEEMKESNDGNSTKRSMFKWKYYDGAKPNKRQRLSTMPPDESSNSSWTEMGPSLYGCARIFPVTNLVAQRFIFQFLASVGVYPEHSAFIYEHNVLGLIMDVINMENTQDARLIFDALHYLNSIATHKKLIWEFVNFGGIEMLLQINPRSVASVSVTACLIYIATQDDLFENICCYANDVLVDLINYALCLMERSHDLTRPHAISFLSETFFYPVLLKIFDQNDGLRILLNQLSMIEMLGGQIYDEDNFQKRQVSRQVCIALKRYCETHLVLKARSLLRGNEQLKTEYPNIARMIKTALPETKSVALDQSLVMEFIGAFLNHAPHSFNWELVEMMTKYNGIKLLLEFVTQIHNHEHNGNFEALRNALDVFAVCTVIPKIQLAFTEKIPANDDQVGLNIFLAIASTSSDPHCQLSALKVILNCVNGPISRPDEQSSLGGGGASGSASKVRKFSKKTATSEDILNKMWNCVRCNNGIGILLHLLMVKTEHAQADLIRTLVCQALCGLARSETVRKVMAKLPLFNSGEIPALMKEPLVPDNQNDHIKFSKSCKDLIERVTGNPLDINIENTANAIKKTEVILQTKIVYDDQDLLQLLHNYLVQKGLNESAQTLAKEADLISNPNLTMKSNLNFSVPKAPSRLPKQFASFPVSSKFDKPFNVNVPKKSREFHLPLRLSKSDKYISTNNRRYSMHFNSPSVRKKIDPSPASNQQSNSVTLDSIVVDYLRKQHAQCRNPVLTCPKFDLTKPHRCPEPINRTMAPLNIAARLQRRKIMEPYGGMYGRKMDRKLIYSRYRPGKTLKSCDGALCAAFSKREDRIYVGTDNGEVLTYNYNTFEVVNRYQPYQVPVLELELARDMPLALLTYETRWSSPSSALWSMTSSSQQEKIAFPDESYVEFSKTVQDKVLGTCEYAAKLYDINTTQLLRTFEDKNIANLYIRNRATFHPYDELILNDGVLWDLRSSNPVHKFDKFNNSYNGVFHPNGDEIICSSEIWDIRTFNLLKTVPLLKEAIVKFNQTGDVIYAYYNEEDDNPESSSPVSHTSFRTLDGTDYSSIATIDNKRLIRKMIIDPRELYLGVVESLSFSVGYRNEHTIRMYEIGAERGGDDFVDEDMEDDEANSDESDDDDSDDEHADDDEGDEEGDDDDDDDGEDFGSDSSSFTSMEAIPVSDYSGQDEEEFLYQLNEDSFD